MECRADTPFEVSVRGRGAPPAPRSRDVCGRRHGELDLGSGALAGEDAQSCADAIRALAHSRQAPVTVAPALQGFCFDAPAVVADAHRHAGREILDLDLDRFRVGMAHRVQESLAADAMYLGPDDRVDWTRRPGDHDTERGPCRQGD